MTDATRTRIAEVDRDAKAAIFLTGFMGAGKSTVGQATAKVLGWPFVDLDDCIERSAGQPIATIFSEYGEDGFRDREHAALAEQAESARHGNSFVLALGGGTYAFARNRELLRTAGITIWLDLDTETLWDRVRAASHRPLAQDQRAFSKLHAARRESYAQADARVDGVGTPDEVVRRIFQLRWMQGVRLNV